MEGQLEQLGAILTFQIEKRECLNQIKARMFSEDHPSDLFMYYLIRPTLRLRARKPLDTRQASFVVLNTYMYAASYVSRPNRIPRS